MADIKTHLREIGVLVGVKNKLENLNYSSSTITINDFCLIADSLLPTTKKLQYNNIRGIVINSTYRQIITNAFNLADTIISKLKITELKKVDWFGYDTGKDEPYDIQINEYFFSLKEDSFILENMGLYKLLNCFTGSKYKKRHIFEDYALPEYKNWFDVTWNALIQYLKLHTKWNYNNPKNTNKSALIELINNVVELTYFEGEIKESCSLPLSCSLDDFKKLTSSNLREGVFSKFIASELKNDATYNASKKTCAVKASDSLANELTRNLSYTNNFARFLRIHTNSYYYAKTTKNGCELYEVPSISTYQQTIRIKSIRGSVPDTQANILTTIENIQTHQILVLRNECRFSHGQFNGTPEAKLYYESNGSLDLIYKKI